MFTEVVGGVLTAVELYEKRATISAFFKRAARFLLNGTSLVGVFGAGGTGKTTLGNFLSGELDTDKTIKGYEETIRIGNFKVKGETPALLSVVPGQEARRPNSWKELYAELSSGKSFRVINVVSWGHHASELEHTAHKVYSENQSNEEFSNLYIKDSLAEELSALETLVPHLIATPGKIRMITLVTKQDLWWNQRHEVDKYYRSGPYSEIIAKIFKSKGEANFSHEYVSCALVEQNLKMADQFTIALTAQGYDDSLRVANLERAYSTITQMIEK